MNDHIDIEINGNRYRCTPDDSVLDACRDNGIFVPTLCEIKEIDQPFGGCRVCLVEIAGPRGTSITTSCDTPVTPGMVVRTETPEVFEGRKASIELLLSEHTGDCIGPCSIECPASLDVQGYLAHIANGRPIEAVKLIKKKSPLAISLGRACFAPCEEECRRVLVEDPIAIRQEKQYAAEIDICDPWTPEIPDDTGRSVGIIGGGPAGLTAAYFLRCKGHDVTIYDMMPELGGMMRYGIPNYRLPKNLLDKEIRWIIDLGVDVKTETKLGVDVSLDELSKKHDVLFVSPGAWESWIVPIEGKDLPRVYGGIDFLIDVSMGKDVPLGDRVVVVGCGNTAMDVARMAIRLGKEVTIAYRRTSEEAPASIEEREEAEEEGVKFMYLTNPEKIHGCKVDGVAKVECARMELGEPDASGRPRPVKIDGENLFLEADSVILAIGQSPDMKTLKEQGLETGKYTLAADSKFMTNLDGVFTAGDVLLGPSSIVECTGQAREAAYAMDAYLNGSLDEFVLPDDYKLPFGYIHTDEKTEDDFADWKKESRASMPMRSPEDRVKDNEAIELGFEDVYAKEEAERCLECGCLDRFQCKLKEYSTLYHAEQTAYQGIKNKFDLDDSHQRVIRDPGKCILCGTCVRTTEEFNEGVVQFSHRGFITVVEPAFGDPLASVDSDLIGALADACPTGALEEKPLGKPGPFDLELLGTANCAACGLCCPAYIYGVSGTPLKLEPVDDPPLDHLCDRGKFSLRENSEISLDVDDILAYLAQGPVDIYISCDTTLDELEILQKISSVVGGGIYCPDAPRHVSSVGLEDLMAADTIYVEEAAYDESPLLKLMVKRAVDAGANLVYDFEELGEGVAVLSSSSDLICEKRIVSQRYANAVGTKDLPRCGSSDARVLAYGIDVEELGVEPESILEICGVDNWLSRKGMVKDIYGDEVELIPVITPCQLELLDEVYSKL